MNWNQLINEVLEKLYKGYMDSGGTSIIDVSPIIHEHNESTQEIGHYFVEQGWVKKERFRPGYFGAIISMAGIKKIRPAHISENREKIISTLGLLGGESIGVMEILAYDPKDYMLAFDLVKEFENAKLITANYHQKDAIIKLTIPGQIEYEQNKADFI